MGNTVAPASRTVSPCDRCAKQVGCAGGATVANRQPSDAAQHRSGPTALGAGREGKARLRCSSHFVGQACRLDACLQPVHAFLSTQH